MIEENGLQIFEPGESPPPTRGLNDDIEVVSKFGFKVVEFDGKQMWQAAAEEDFRNSEAKRLDIKPEQVETRAICYQTGPKRCAGRCINIHLSCVLVYNPMGAYYYCVCR